VQRDPPEKLHKKGAGDPSHNLQGENPRSVPATGESTIKNAENQNTSLLVNWKRGKRVVGSKIKKRQKGEAKIEEKATMLN